jgi:hypothetical protein
MVIPETHTAADGRFIPDDVPRRTPAPKVNWAFVALMVVGLAAVWLWIGSFPEVQPMPCAQNEVYEWTNYPTDAGCVDKEDL